MYHLGFIYGNTMEGLKVVRVDEGTYGDTIGLIAGDIIVRYADRKTPNIWTLESVQKFLMEIGSEEATLEFLRKGKKEVIQVIPKKKLNVEMESFTKKPAFDAVKNISQVAEMPVITLISYFLGIVAFVASLIMMSQESDTFFKVAWVTSGLIQFVLFCSLGMIVHYIKGIFINTQKE